MNVFIYSPKLFRLRIGYYYSHLPLETGTQSKLVHETHWAMQISAGFLTWVSLTSEPMSFLCTVLTPLVCKWKHHSLILSTIGKCTGYWHIVDTQWIFIQWVSNCLPCGEELIVFLVRDMDQGHPEPSTGCCDSLFLGSTEENVTKDTGCTWAGRTKWDAQTGKELRLEES